MDRITKVEQIIKQYLPEEEGYQKTIFEAMNYSVMVGGKRLRPIMMLESYKMFGGNGTEIEPFMAAMEMVHTYSLVHDDLPAMDNDLYRRGKKTTHAVYGEAMGILAGDALLNYAFETATKAFELTSDPNCVAKALQVFLRKTGVYGMVGGQVVDVESEKKNETIVDLDKILFIHRLKTAALIEASLMVGAILAGATESDVKKIEECGTHIGLAFQIQDDILDITSTFEELGKPIGSDLKNDKSTYVSLVGLEQSKEDVKKHSKEAIAILDDITKQDCYLKELIMELVDRRK